MCCGKFTVCVCGIGVMFGVILGCWLCGYCFDLVSFVVWCAVGVC